MRSYLVLFVTFALASSALAQVKCPENACQTVRCAAPAAECLTDAATMAATHHRLLPKGGYCGCCPLCVNLLQENANCMATELIGVPHRVLCDDGLHCDHTTHKCVKTV